MIKTKTQNNQTIFEFEQNQNIIANSIRRLILDEVPTFAIELVGVVKNDSPLYDETIAQRLGLVPLKTDLKSYNFKEICSCGGIGCALCEVKLSLVKKGPGYVYTSEIKSDDPQIVPTDLKIPITKLFNDNSQIELNLKAVLGTGRVHAKWSPAHTYLREEDKKVNLVVESYGQLENKEIFNNAIDIAIEKLKELEEKL